MDFCSYQKTPEVVDKFVQRAGNDILTQTLHCKTWFLSFCNTTTCLLHPKSYYHKIKLEMQAKLQFIPNFVSNAISLWW